jgi:hypothetical protein
VSPFNRPALIQLRTTVVTPNAAKPRGAGFAERGIAVSDIYTLLIISDLIKAFFGNGPLDNTPYRSLVVDYQYMREAPPLTINLLKLYL